MDKDKTAENRKSGQVMLEYIVSFAICLALVVITGMLLYAFKTFGGRVLSLMSTA
jgi:uncharacterized protein (UPF0333 family)